MPSEGPKRSMDGMVRVRPVDGSVRVSQSKAQPQAPAPTKLLRQRPVQSAPAEAEAPVAAKPKRRWLRRLMMLTISLIVIAGVVAAIWFVYINYYA